MDIDLHIENEIGGPVIFMSGPPIFPFLFIVLNCLKRSANSKLESLLMKI